MRSMLKLTPVILGLALLFALQVRADVQGEKQAEKPNVQDRAQKVFQEAYPDWKIAEMKMETIDSVTYYEIEAVKGKTKKDFIYSEDFTLVQIEEEISIDKLPEKVVKSILAVYPDCEVDEVEMITRGEITEYAVEIEVGDKEFEALVSSDGTILGTEEETGEEDEVNDDDDNDDAEKVDDDDK